jgi:hypothetical protein
MLNSAVQRGQPSSTVVAARFDEDVIARVRDIDRYQHGVIRDRLSVGHGRSLRNGDSHIAILEGR